MACSEASTLSENNRLDEMNSFPLPVQIEHATIRKQKVKHREPSTSPFRIRLRKLPVSESFVAHPGVFPTLPTVFATKFSALFEHYCQNHTLQELRRTFALEVEEADSIWKTQNVDSLTNWLAALTSSTLRVQSLVTLLVGSILISLQRTLDVLSTLSPLANDFEVRACCLHIAGFIHKTELLENSTLMQQYDAEVDRLRVSFHWTPSGLSIDHLRLLLWRSNIQQARELLETLKEKYHTVDVRTTLFITSFCASIGLPDLAYRFLADLPQTVLRKPSAEVMQCCSQLLKHDFIIQTSTGPNFRYLSKLLEKGLTPDDVMYNQIIEKALDTEYTGVAWDVYHYAQSIGAVLSWRTYLVLLRHAFLSNNVKRLDEIMLQVHGQKQLYTNRCLLMYAMNMVRRINRSQRNMTAVEGLSHILALYDRAFSRTSLAKFGFVPAPEKISAEDEKVEPDIYLLSFTVWAFILCHKQGTSAAYLWNSIMESIQEGDETIIQCMKLDLVYNAFIWLYLRDKHTVSSALEVFQYMLEKRFCLPTARTWSILICGFLRHGQRSQAQEIYELMHRHGFSMAHICEEYLSSGVKLEDLETRIDDVLDEDKMPDGTDLQWTVNFADTSHVQDESLSSHKESGPEALRTDPAIAPYENGKFTPKLETSLATSL